MAAERIARFVRSIKSQTRGGSAPTFFDPAGEVDATVALLRHELEQRRLAVHTRMERGHRLRGDATRFGIVVQNLVVNALDAYDGRPGEVWIRLGAADGRLELSVEDRGCGIPEELRERIFEYLFTTKEPGRGTGLGLPMVQAVVAGSFGGEIALESEVGRGTRFTVSIPFNEGGSDHGA